MSKHDQTEECQNPRACPEHDTGEHWVDDYAYVMPVPASANHTYEEMLDLLRNFDRNEPDMRVARFALVIVDGEGKIDVLSHPSANANALINLLTRAAGLIAFNEHIALLEQQQAMQKLMANAMYGKTPAAFYPFPGFPDRPDDSSGETENYNGGNLYP